MGFSRRSMLDAPLRYWDSTEKSPRQAQVRLKMSFHDLMRVILVMILRRVISLASEAYLLQEE